MEWFACVAVAFLSGLGCSDYVEWPLQLYAVAVLRICVAVHGCFGCVAVAVLAIVCFAFCFFFLLFFLTSGSEGELLNEHLIVFRRSSVQIQNFLVHGLHFSFSWYQHSMLVGIHSALCLYS